MRARLAGALYVALGLASCRPEDDEGSLTGSLRVPACRGESPRAWTCEDEASPDCAAFDLDPDFFALDYLGDFVVVRMQHGARSASQVDALHLQIRDTRKIRGRLGEALTVGPQENVRAALSLFDRCPGSTQSIALTGQVVLSRFGTDGGDRVEGEILELAARDARTGEVLGRLRGDFDFEVREGPPYERFAH